MPGVNTVTAAIARAGHPEVRLYRDSAGYHYFTFDNTKEELDGAPVSFTFGDKLVFETESAMCPRFGDLPHDRWVADGIAFAEKIKREKA